MAPDEFQQAWQAQASQTRVTIDADLLRQEVRRDQQAFRTMILYRDYGEVGVALLLIPIRFVLGAVTKSPLPWYLALPVLDWMPGFILVDLRRHRAGSGVPALPRLQCL